MGKWLGKSEDRVVIVSRDEWEAVKNDIIGLRRFAALEAQDREAQARERIEQNQRFAQAIDALEARVNEFAGLLSAVAQSAQRSDAEFSNRLDRASARLGTALDAIAELQRRPDTVLDKTSTLQSLTALAELAESEVQ